MTVTSNELVDTKKQCNELVGNNKYYMQLDTLHATQTRKSSSHWNIVIKKYIHATIFHWLIVYHQNPTCDDQYQFDSMIVTVAIADTMQGKDSLVH